MPKAITGLRATDAAFARPGVPCEAGIPRGLASEKL